MPVGGSRMNDAPALCPASVALQIRPILDELIHLVRQRFPSVLQKVSVTFRAPHCRGGRHTLPGQRLLLLHSQSSPRNARCCRDAKSASSSANDT